MEREEGGLWAIVHVQAGHEVSSEQWDFIIDHPLSFCLLSVSSLFLFFN